MGKRRNTKESPSNRRVGSSKSTGSPRLPLNIEESRPSPKRRRNPSAETQETQTRASRILLELSKACNSHLPVHQEPSDTSGEKRGRNEEQAIREQCRRDLGVLKSLLPKVEKAFRPTPDGPKANDIAHLCAFYDSVVDGSYCPHTPHLVFDVSGNCSEVIRRVHRLFEYLGSRPVYDDAATSVKDSSKTQSTIDVLTRTISKLLCAIPGVNRETAIVLDLIDMLDDLRAVSESDLVLSRTSYARVRTFERIQTTLEIQIQPLGCTITSREALAVITSSTVSICQQVLIGFRQRRLTHSIVHNPVQKHVVSGDSDSVLFPVQRRKRAVSRLAFCMQHFVKKSAEDKTLDLDLWACLIMKPSLQLIMTIAEDLNETSGGFPSSNAYLCLAKAVVFSIQWLLRWKSGDATWTRLVGDASESLLLNGARIRSSPSHDEAGKTVCLSLLPELLDTIPLLQNVDGRVESIVVALILIGLQGKQGEATSALTFCTARGLMSHIFRLLRDRTASVDFVMMTRCLLVGTWDIALVSKTVHEKLPSLGLSTSVFPKRTRKRSRDRIVDAQAGELTASEHRKQRRVHRGTPMGSLGPVMDSASAEKCFADGLLREFFIDSLALARSLQSMQDASSDSNDCNSCARQVINALLVLLDYLGAIPCVTNAGVESILSLCAFFLRSFTVWVQSIPGDAFGDSVVVVHTMAASCLSSLRCKGLTSDKMRLLAEDVLRLSSSCQRHMDTASLASDFADISMAHRSSVLRFFSSGESLSSSGAEARQSSILFKRLVRRQPYWDEASKAFVLRLPTSMIQRITHALTTSEVQHGADSRRSSDCIFTPLTLLASKPQANNAADFLSALDQTLQALRSVVQLARGATSGESYIMNYCILIERFCNYDRGILNETVVGMDMKGVVDYLLVPFRGQTHRVAPLAAVRTADPRLLRAHRETLEKLAATKDLFQSRFVRRLVWKLVSKHGLRVDMAQQLIRSRGPVGLQENISEVVSNLVARSIETDGIIGGDLAVLIHALVGELGYLYHGDNKARVGSHPPTMLDGMLDVFVEKAREAAICSEELCAGERGCSGNTRKAEYCATMAFRHSALSTFVSSIFDSILFGGWFESSTPSSMTENTPSVKLQSSQRSAAFVELARTAEFFAPQGVHSHWTTLPSLASTCMHLFEGKHKHPPDSDVLFVAHHFMVLRGRVPRLQSAQTSSALSALIDAELPVVAADLKMRSLDVAVEELVRLREKNLVEGRRALRHDKARVMIVGGTNFSSGPRASEARLGTKIVQKRAHELCFGFEVGSKVATNILLRADDSHFRSLCLNRAVATKILKQIKQSEQIIVKRLVWRLGSLDPSMVQAAERGLRRAASSLAADSLVTIEEASPPEHTSEWVSRHFMFLLVNVIQVKWADRTYEEQLHTLRCFDGLLDLLHSRGSAQFLPQVLSTVSVVLDFERDPFWNNESQNLHFLVMKAFKKFVCLAFADEVDAVRQNLTNIVVCAMTVLEPSNVAVEGGLAKQASTEAVQLLEFLSSGKNGEHMAAAFDEVPFLPNTAELERVRSSLRSHGVHLDDLALMSVGTQGSNPPKLGSHTSADVSDVRPESRCGSLSSESDKLDSLQRRLRKVCALLDNENTRVRQAVLVHLSDLLRANRSLFQAFVESESGRPSRRFLTKDLRLSQANESGPLSLMLEKLLSRCSRETDDVAREKLAICIGEVGAIGEHLIGELRVSSAIDALVDEQTGNLHSWRLSQPPWQSQETRYELKVITGPLVGALKAAPSSNDQHKIAFAIQEILILLDASARLEGDPSRVRRPNRRKKDMHEWLRDQLTDANVFKVVEPFWGTEFDERTSQLYYKKPPFYRNSSSHFGWLSAFCRWMIVASHECKSSRWNSFFYACRTAVRSTVGVAVAEFLLPVLVLDRICFGGADQERVVKEEILDVLSSDNVSISMVERQKSVNSVFVVLDTLGTWSERATEAQYSSRSTKTLSRPQTTQKLDSIGNSWHFVDVLDRIEDLLKEIPLSRQALAASEVGMHSRALQLLEKDARSRVVSVVYDGDGNDSWSPETTKIGKVLSPAETSLMLAVLSELDDSETMSAVAKSRGYASATDRVGDAIRQNEASGDWQSALENYERVLLLSRETEEKGKSQVGALRCLLEMGKCHGILNQVAGMMHPASRPLESNEMGLSIVSLAAEAAWRLGDWGALDSFVQRGNTMFAPSDLSYRDLHMFAQSEALLGLKTGNLGLVESSIRQARHSILSSLSSIESYGRCYPWIVRLHALREIEDAAVVLCESQHDSGRSSLEMIDLSEGWNWTGRMDTVSPRGMPALISARLAIARLGGDRIVEGKLFSKLGRYSRKQGSFAIAVNHFTQAEACFRSASSDQRFVKEDLLGSLQTDLAELKHKIGESSSALALLDDEGLQILFDDLLAVSLLDEKRPRLLASNYELKRLNNLYGPAVSLSRKEKSLVKRVAERLLKVTTWMVEGGLKGGNEVLARFRVVNTLAPDWNKGHFHYAKHIDTMLESRLDAKLARRTAASIDDDSLRGATIGDDLASQKYMVLSICHYIKVLELDSQYLYQTLPRLLSLWFELTSASCVDISNDDALEASKSEASEKVRNSIATIPSKSFYTVFAQLISRVTHVDETCAKIVQEILSHVLSRHPAQAMWPLAWLRGSRNKERKRIGEDIFKEALTALQDKKRMGYKLLDCSPELFKFLQDLAEYPVKGTRGPHLRVKPWSGSVDLSEFCPPVQAALSVDMLSSYSKSDDDFFPRSIPRMRAISSKVEIFSSKARPKKLTIFVVDGSFRRRRPSGRKSNIGTMADSEHDIGEIHFLVKQEAKGDLRKDARVQDLNNVVNRLMVDSAKSEGNARKRRIRLRTFTVTCLSEDTGILEWVPNTDSMRNLIAKSYNPQASPYSSCRRGARSTNFADAGIRSSYEQAQNLYFKQGQLEQAVQRFRELCLKPNPPHLYWWFIRNFDNPHSWYEARNRFTLSAAIWSGVGHIIGLGDRHSENILVDTVNGECVHVDFDCIFDKGLHLPKPEVVPFRLTQNMVDAFGPTGSDGMFNLGLQTVMRTLRDNRDTLLSVLEPFLKDPVIEWRRNRSQQSQQKQTTSHPVSTQENRSRAAKRSIHAIDERLRGMYNLKNPNHAKYKRVDGSGFDQQDDEMARMVPLSVEGQVSKMIQEASKHENLLQLFVGWMPWV